MSVIETLCLKLYNKAKMMLTSTIVVLDEYQDCIE